MNITTIFWQWHPFTDLTPQSLYQVLQLRAAVFVVEQKCAYQDIDGKDPDALHLLGWVANPQGERQLAAYARLFLPTPENLSQPVSFGRIVVAEPYRREKLGQQLVKQILDYIQTSPCQSRTILISAQHYLVRFYEKFGFQTQGAVYDEDGIPHIQMVLEGGLGEFF